MMHFDHTILLAHGSRDKRWAAPFETIIASASQRHSEVSLAYMELSSPSLEQAVSRAHRKGAKRIAVLPLFFAAGKHLREDVPTMLTEISSGTGAEVTLLPPVGEQPEFLTAINGIIDKLLSPTPSGEIG